MKKCFMYMILMCFASILNAQTYVVYDLTTTNKYVNYVGASCIYDAHKLQIDNTILSMKNWYYVYGIATTTNEIPVPFSSLNQLESYTDLNITNQFTQAQVMINNIVNVYTNMLENRWTACLQTAGLISETNKITLYNTSSAQNMTYLIMLANNPATIDQYKSFSSEFRVIVDTLKELGVDISDLSN